MSRETGWGGMSVSLVSSSLPHRRRLQLLQQTLWLLSNWWTPSKSSDLTDVVYVYYTANMINESCKKQFVHPAPLYTPQDVHFFMQKNCITRGIYARKYGTITTEFPLQQIPIVAIFGHSHPHSWWFSALGCPLLVMACFRWLVATFGTVCHLTSHQLRCQMFFLELHQNLHFPDHFLPERCRFQ